MGPDTVIRRPMGANESIQCIFKGSSGSTKKCESVCPLQGSIHISSQPDSRDGALIKDNTELFLGTHPTSPLLLVFPLNIYVLCWTEEPNSLSIKRPL